MKPSSSNKAAFISPISTSIIHKKKVTDKNKHLKQSSKQKLGSPTIMPHHNNKVHYKYTVSPSSTKYKIASSKTTVSIGAKVVKRTKNSNKIGSAKGTSSRPLKYWFIDYTNN